MIIDEDLLFASGAALYNIKKNDYIFKEQTTPKYYFQIQKGKVKINNYQSEGKEFIHSLPSEGHCVGETFLFSDEKYPVNAVAMEDCTVIRLAKPNFIDLIIADSKLLLRLYHYTAERMRYRYIMLNHLTTTNPFTKLVGLMDCLKNFNKKTKPFSYEIPYTRQEMASLTGLRVETVIRSIKKLERENVLKIENGKIIY